ncbi:hypothetical protein TNCV_2120441 [Trichonephila clavipes]|nr:hypothetical protein TNCV_2120441 [Trichonephila clavipes]
MCTAVMHYRECKFFSVIDVSEKPEKVPKTSYALDIRRLPAPLKASERFLRRYYMNFNYFGATILFSINVPVTNGECYPLPRQSQCCKLSFPGWAERIGLSAQTPWGASRR